MVKPPSPTGEVLYVVVVQDADYLDSDATAVAVATSHDDGMRALREYVIRQVTDHGVDALVWDGLDENHPALAAYAGLSLADRAAAVRVLIETPDRASIATLVDLYFFDADDRWWDIAATPMWWDVPLTVTMPSVG